MVWWPSFSPQIGETRVDRFGLPKHLVALPHNGCRRGQQTTESGRVGLQDDRCRPCGSRRRPSPPTPQRSVRGERDRRPPLAVQRTGAFAIGNDAALDAAHRHRAMKPAARDTALGEGEPPAQVDGDGDRRNDGSHSRYEVPASVCRALPSKPTAVPAQNRCGATLFAAWVRRTRDGGIDRIGAHRSRITPLCPGVQRTQSQRAPAPALLTSMTAHARSH